MKRRDGWAWLLAAALGSAGCLGDTVDTGDTGVMEERREICYPSCRLGQVCTAENRCVAPMNPFRDAGFARDRGAN